MKTKLIINFLLTTLLAYCICMWLYFGISFVFSLHSGKWLKEAFIVSLFIAVNVALFLTYTLRRIEYIIPYDKKDAFLKRVYTELSELGFEASSTKNKFLKYKAFLWFSFIDSKIKIAIKKDSNLAIIKGRKQDVELLMQKLHDL